MRFQLDHEISEFQREKQEAEKKRRLLGRLEVIAGEELHDSRELEDTIVENERQLRSIRKDVSQEKERLYGHSLNNQFSTDLLRTRYEPLKELELKQETLLSRISNPFLKDTSSVYEALGVGKLYSPQRYNDTPIH